MEEFGIIPKAIDKSILRVQFNSSEVTVGNILKPKEVKDIPVVSWDSSNLFHTLVMFDLDAPSRQNPEYRSVQHWLVVNIPGQDVSQGQTQTEFLSSAPGKNDGLHRYVFLLYAHPNPLVFDGPTLDKKSILQRKSFSIRDFAKKYNLGEPVAGNFYQAEWDEFVVNLRKERGLPP